MRILVAEDEKDLLEILVKRLKAEGYGVDGCRDGEDAAAYLTLTEYDLAILDIMMPKKDGLTVLREARLGRQKLPILLLTAKDSTADRVAGLDAGADDYLVKPFAFEELLARVRMLLRRNSQEKTDLLQAADLTMEVAAHRVMRAGIEIDLSAREFALLEYLLRNKDVPLSRSQLENHIWDYEFEGGSNIVDVYVRYLRKKIDDPFEKKLIQTRRGIGYLIKDKEE